MITSRDKRYFRMAAHIASLGTFCGRVKLGCVVVYHGKVISTGCNRDKSDPLQKKYNQERSIPDYSPHKVHAEVDAIKHIIGLDINWNDVSIYIARPCRSKPFGMARPCSSCMKLIKDVGIRHIYYTTDNGYVYEEIE